MENLHEENQQTSLDLTFQAFNNEDSIHYRELSNTIYLNEFSFWLNELSIWLDYIKKDNTSLCPQLLRETKSFGIGLQLTDDSYICELNKKWRNVPKQTDVLSFPVFDQALITPENNYVELGDIVVSLQTAYKQAIEQDHHLSVELRWLVSHGLLHLLGWDHPDDKSLDNMLTFQEQLLSISGNVRRR